MICQSPVARAVRSRTVRALADWTELFDPQVAMVVWERPVDPLATRFAGEVLAHAKLEHLLEIEVADLDRTELVPADALAALVAGLALGTPALSWLGAVCAALTLGTRAGGALLALLVLPLAVPVLIFGAGAAEAVAAGLGAQAHLSLLGAGLLLASLAGPFATALAVRIAYE